MARWAQETYRISERHAARLVKLAIGTLRYEAGKCSMKCCAIGYGSWRERTCATGIVV